LFILSSLPKKKRRKTCGIGILSSLHIPSHKLEKVVEKNSVYQRRKGGRHVA